MSKRGRSDYGDDERDQKRVRVGESIRTLNLTGKVDNIIRQTIHNDVMEGISIIDIARDCYSWWLRKSKLPSAIHELMSYLNDEEKLSSNKYIHFLTFLDVLNNADKSDQIDIIMNNEVVNHVRMVFARFTEFDIANLVNSVVDMGALSVMIKFFASIVISCIETRKSNFSRNTTEKICFVLLSGVLFNTFYEFEGKGQLRNINRENQIIRNYMILDSDSATNVMIDLYNKGLIESVSRKLNTFFVELCGQVNSSRLNDELRLMMRDILTESRNRYISMLFEHFDK